MSTTVDADSLELLEAEDLEPLPIPERVGTGLLNGPGDVVPRHDRLDISRQLLPQRSADFVEPSYLWLPEHAVASRGAELVDFSTALRRPMDDEQVLAAHLLYAEDDDGHLATLESAIIAPRRNLKTHVLEAAALYDLFVGGDEVVIWTAHLFSTTQETIRVFFALLEEHAWLSRQVKKINKENGSEGIELLSGARLLFKARSLTGGRGMFGDKLYCDEALFLKGQMIAALLPLLATRPDPQIRYGSSAGLRVSAFLRSLRERGRAGGDESLSWLEYAAPRTDCAAPTCDHGLRTRGCALSRRDLIAAANFAVDRRITWRYLRGERRTFAALPVEYAAERLGWWEDPPPDETDDVEPPAYDLTVWNALLLDAEANGEGDDPQALLHDVRLAIDVSPSGQSADLALAGVRPDGRKQVEHIDSREGTGWIVREVSELRQRLRTQHGIQGQVPVVVDPGSQAGKLVEPLRKAGIEPTLLTVRQVAAAAGALADDLREGNLAHTAPDGSAVAMAVQDARWRPLAGAQALRPGPLNASIGGLVAVGFAAWAVVALRSKAGGGLPVAVDQSATDVVAGTSSPYAVRTGAMPSELDVAPGGGSGFDALRTQW